jgi:hypothetical protein
MHTQLHPGGAIPTLTICYNGFLNKDSIFNLRRTAGYTLLNHKRNEEILEELHVTPLED